MSNTSRPEGYIRFDNTTPDVTNISAGIVDNVDPIHARVTYRGLVAGSGINLSLISEGTYDGIIGEAILISSTGGSNSGTLTYSQLPSNVQNIPLICSVPGSPSSSAILWYIPIVLTFTIPASFTGSLAIAGTIATSTSIFTLQYIRSGVSSLIGSITFTSSSTNGSFSYSTGYSSNIGDILTLTAPATVDATLANIGISILAYKS